MEEYAQVIKRRKRQLSDISTRGVGEYADDNTALVAGGALALGILLGVAFSKRSAQATALSGLFPSRASASGVIRL